MGGKKKGGGVLGAVTGFAKDSLKTGTLGLYNPDTGSIGTKDMQKNYESGISVESTQEGAFGKAEEPLAVEDPAMQKAKADAEAKKAVDDLYANSGVASTILGGSTSTDSGTLKKKKLLGE